MDQEPGGLAAGGAEEAVAEMAGELGRAAQDALRPPLEVGLVPGLHPARYQQGHLAGVGGHGGVLKAHRSHSYSS
jgi:hypothetical protein